MDPVVGQGLLRLQTARPQRGGQGEGWGLSTSQDPAQVRGGRRMLGCPARKPRGIRLFKN